MTPNALARRLVRVAAADLRPGMYVAELDRPWLETPFLYQGFTIEDEAGLDALRAHCRWAMVPQEHVPAGVRPYRDTVAPAHPARPPVAVGFARPATPRPVVCSVEDELDAAEPVHERLRMAVAEIFDGLGAGRGLKLDAVQQAVLPVIDSVGRNPDAMLWLTRLRGSDTYIYRHAMRTAVLAAGLGRHLGLARPELESLTTGVLLMDIGKTGLREDLLQRETPFSERERAAFRQHVAKGISLLRRGDDPGPAALQIVTCHHERWDGSGYPRGLSGDRIPAFARMAGLVDTYDAMTGERGYLPRFSAHDALIDLSRQCGHLFERAMVEQFIQSTGAFPTGSLVELSSGEVGIVLEQNRVRRLRPRVMLVLAADKAPLREFRTVDLMLENDLRHEEALHIARPLSPGTYGLDPEEFYL